MKKFIFAASLIIIMVCGFFAASEMAKSPPVYDGSNVDVVGLYENPSSYDNSTADSAAAVIVNLNKEKTVADNVVFSVVFNYRGYDTLGESFILIAAIAGATVILRKAGKKHGEGDAH